MYINILCDRIILLLFMISMRVCQATIKYIDRAKMPIHCLVAWYSLLSSAFLSLWFISVLRVTNRV